MRYLVALLCACLLALPAFAVTDVPLESYDFHYCPAGTVPSPGTPGSYCGGALVAAHGLALVPNDAYIVSYGAVCGQSSLMAYAKGQVPAAVCWAFGPQVDQQALIPSTNAWSVDYASGAPPPASASLQIGDGDVGPITAAAAVILFCSWLFRLGLDQLLNRR